MAGGVGPCVSVGVGYSLLPPEEPPDEPLMVATHLMAGCSY